MSVTCQVVAGCLYSRLDEIEERLSVVLCHSHGGRVARDRLFAPCLWLTFITSFRTTT